MTGKFQYSILKYRHSYVAGEVFNIGIIFLFSNGRVEFLYPNKLGRLSSLFHKSPISFLKNTLTAFKSKSNQVSNYFKESRLFTGDLAEIISHYFLTESSGALFFSDVKTGAYFDNEKAIEKHYYSLYLGQYEEEITSKKNEKYIIDRVKSIIREKFSADTERKLKVEKTLTDPNGSFSETFNYGWQNKQLHLITPLGFDLSNEQSLEAKAIKWYGILNFLKEPALKEDVKFDILLTEPTEPSLKKSYYKAKDIIERIEAPVGLIEEREFDSYLEHAVETVNEHESEIEDFDEQY